MFVQYMILNSFFGIITTFCIMPYGDCVWLNMYLSWYELLHVFASATTIHIILALFHVSLLVNKLSILLFKWVNKYLLLFYLHIFYTICKYYTLLTHFFLSNNRFTSIFSLLLQMQVSLQISDTIFVCMLIN